MERSLTETLLIAILNESLLDYSDDLRAKKLRAAGLNDLEVLGLVD